MTDEELGEVKVLVTRALADVGTSTYAYKALVRVPELIEALGTRTKRQSNATPTAATLEEWLEAANRDVALGSERTKQLILALQASRAGAQLSREHEVLLSRQVEELSERVSMVIVDATQAPIVGTTNEDLKRHEERSRLGLTASPVLTRRLIAALRASRKREAALVEQVNEAARLLARIGAEREKELSALRASRKEVDRLRGFLDDESRLNDEARKAYESEALQDWRAQQ